MDSVVWGPIMDVCDLQYGPFEAMRQMTMRIQSVASSFNYGMAISTQTVQYLSIIFFGETGHYLLDIDQWLDTYVWIYTDQFKTLGGSVENELHLMSMLFDSYLQPIVFNLIKTPVCGVEADTTDDL